MDSNIQALFKDPSENELLDNEFTMIKEMDSTMIEGADDISSLQLQFRNDILYKMLERAGLSDKILTSFMYEKLKLGLNYRPQDASILTEVNEGTLRGWLNGKDSMQLPVYINASREGKFHILDAEAVFRVRLIYLVQKDLKLSLNHIANICTGKTSNVKIVPNSSNDDILTTINDLKDKNDLLENQNRILYGMLSTLFEQDFEGEWKLKNQALPQLLESNPKFEEMQKNIDTLNSEILTLKEDLQKEKEKNKIDVKLEISKINMLYKKAEYLALENRSLFEKLFNKKPNIETIEKFFSDLRSTKHE